MKKIIPVIVFLSGIFIQPVLSQVDSANAQYAVRDTHNVNVKLFDSDDLFEIALRFDITTYKRKRSDTAYLDAVLTYYTGDKDSVNKNIKLKARGEIRRTSNICDFPPLSLNFKLKDSVAGEFIGINKLKLVPYCKLGYEEYVLREYLVYKLYNVLTDNSFRVRLMRITLINTAKDRKTLTQFGFAIEPIKLLEKRTHSREIERPLTQKNIKPEMMDRYAIFNYMIGNTDWSVPAGHNALVLSQPFSENPDLGLIVPFDFDYAGLVNAEYATPFPSLPIKTVRERLYLGICRSEEVFKNDLKEFSDKKEQFFKVINDFPYLNPRSKKDIINFLEGFYSDFDKRNSIVYKLRSQCLDF